MKIGDTVLDELRPPVVPLDPAWSQATLTRVMAGPGRGTPAPRRRRRRLALVALAAAAVSVAGVGVASADGLMPQAFTDTFASWRHWPGRPAADPSAVDPSGAERVATAPGPDGTVFSVMSTGHGGAYSCRAAVVETAASAREPGPSSFTDVTGSFCSDGPTLPTFGGVGVSNQDVAAGYTVSAGDAVRAEVRTADGRAYPALLVEGDFWGWFPPGEHPVLVGYAADGSVVGRVRL